MWVRIGASGVVNTVMILRDSLKCGEPLQYIGNHQLLNEVPAPKDDTC
jgi:hypothetical protein